MRILLRQRKRVEVEEKEEEVEGTESAVELLGNDEKNVFIWQCMTEEAAFLWQNNDPQKRIRATRVVLNV